MIFRNRKQAGQLLAEKLRKYTDRQDVIVLALPRGGVPVGFEVAQALHAAMDIFVVRKLGVPGQEELAMGAIAGGGVRVINYDVVNALMISEETIEIATSMQRAELERREQIYRGDRPQPEVRGKVAILVDDGLATGASMRAAVRALRKLDPARIVVAVPTGAPSTCREFDALADETICLTTPEPFYGVGAWYDDFSQTTDEEVRELLEMAEEKVAG
jgi:predicted phosphoribosyltransferase